MGEVIPTFWGKDRHNIGILIWAETFCWISPPFSHFNLLSMLMTSSGTVTKTLNIFRKKLKNLPRNSHKHVNSV